MSMLLCLGASLWNGWGIRADRHRTILVACLSTRSSMWDAETHEQRREWESIVFAEDSKSDPQAIAAYLSTIFEGTSRAKKALKTPAEVLRDSMKSFHFWTS